MHAAGFDPVAHFNSVNAAVTQGRLLHAAQLCRDALQRMPGHPTFAVLLSNILCRLGDADQATAATLSAAPHCTDMPDFWSALANAANAAWTPTAEQVFEYHARYGQSLRKQRPDQPLPITDPDPDRTLRIGLVNAGFKLHSSLSFFTSALLRHLPPGFELFAYQIGPDYDAGTDAHRPLVSELRFMPAASNDELASQIRQDRIDVAIDINSHTGIRRLPAFQPRCAPVQVTFLAYSNTTGLSSIDWRIVDNTTDPPGSERLATERLWRLDPCFLCFQPDPLTPPVRPAPSLSRRHITFGAFSDLFKLNDEVLRRWATVVNAVPGSRLLLKNRAPTIPDAATFLLQRLVLNGHDLARVDLRGPTHSYPDHLAMYADVDIALDTIPYNGTTTVCESLLMGVPIVGVRPDAAHDRHAARVTLSILTAAGLTDLIADDEHDLVRKCVQLAADPQALSARRAGIREQFLASPVCAAEPYAQRFWGAIREMWRDRLARPA